MFSAVVSNHDWNSRAEALDVRHQPFIDCRYVGAALVTITFDDLGPVDGRVQAKVAACDAEDAGRAVAATQLQFGFGGWSRTAPGPRPAQRRFVRAAVNAS